MRKTVIFLDQECNVHIGKYQSNDRFSISLSIKETGEPMATATSNIPELFIARNHVAIKTYGGNEGLMEILQLNEIISSQDYVIESTFKDFPVCRILVDPKDYR